ncbi:MAG: V-type ATP synthase subunit I [Eubacteriales bacterium]|nr:V-type ATP synthase subunit I [Eubacteriales bacterium]
MAIAKMEHITFVGAQSDMSSVVNALSKLGAIDVRRNESLEAEIQSRQLEMIGHEYRIEIPGLDFHEAFRTRMAQLSDPENQDEGLLSRSMTDYPRLVAECQRLMDRLDAAVELSANLAPRKEGLFHHRRVVSARAFAELAARQEEIQRRMREFEDEEQKLRHLELDLSKAYQRREEIEFYRDLELPHLLSRSGEYQQGTEHVAVYVGTVLTTESINDIELALQEAEQSAYSFEILKKIDEGAVVLLAAERSEAETIARIAGQNGFKSLPSIDDEYKGRYALALEERKQTVEGLKREIEVAKQNLEDFAKYREDFENLSDFYRVQKSRLETLQMIAQTSSIFVLEGYVPQRRADQIIELICQRYPLAVERRLATTEEDYPVLLENPKWAQPFEEVISTFALPKPGVDIDPTVIMAPTYVFFFGMMLSDVGYGLILSVLMALILWVFKTEGRSMRKMCTVFFLCGISSIIWGALFGGFFGNTISSLIKVFHIGGANPPGNPLERLMWFDPMTNPVKLMVFSVIFGIIHLFIAMANNMYMLCVTGNKRSAFTEVFPWYIIFLSLAGLLLAKQGQLPIDSKYFGYLAIAACLVIVLLSPCDSKNPIVRLFKGLLKLYDITSFFSEMMSYTRILALALATSVIAMVVNTLAIMPVEKKMTILGFVAMLLIWVFGHIINFALSALSAYIHTTRLQYVEFFGRFYQGGGQPFKPFEVPTEYVVVDYAKDPQLQIPVNSALKRA